MSKSLYQFTFNPEQRQNVEQILNKAIADEKYRYKGVPNTFTYGSGWFSAKRRLEYKISNGILHICIWKVVAPVIPMIEMGCCDASNAYGSLLNSGMQATVNRIAEKINQTCPISPMTMCKTVDDNFLDIIQNV